MGLIQASRQSTGGGGGGLTISGFQNQQFVQTTNFESGDVVIALSQTPIAVEGIEVDYNGQTLLYGSSWSYASGSITILFADPYVTDYDTPPVFQIYYPY